MEKGKIKTILEDYWNEFLKVYKIKLDLMLRKKLKKF